MYMLRQRITSKTALTGTPTWRYKLPNIGKFTAFELVVDCNRHADRADAAVTYPLETQITKLELVEGGSKSLLSLTASQLDALNYWTFGRPNARRHRNAAATGNLLHLFLTGGRGLYDTEFGFDMAKLAETYLEYTHTFLDDTVEKFDVSDHEVTLYGWRWMGAGSPDFKGYFRTRQLASWATSASGTLKTIELPTGNPYRLIGFQAKSDDTTLGGTASKLELKVNNGEYSPVTITSLMHWAMQEVTDYNLDNEIGGMEYLLSTSANEIPRWWSYLQTIAAIVDHTYAAESIKAGGITLPARLNAQTTGGIEAWFNTRGWGFQKCLRIGFDHLFDGGDLLHTRGMGALDLEVTEGGASKDAAVFVQDVLTY